MATIEIVSGQKLYWVEVSVHSERTVQETRETGEDFQCQVSHVKIREMDGLS